MSLKLARSFTKLPQKSADDSAQIQDQHTRNTNIKVVGRFRPIINLEKELGEDSALKL